jgi:hypothetical protein
MEIIIRIFVQLAAVSAVMMLVGGFVGIGLGAAYEAFMWVTQ